MRVQRARVEVAEIAGEERGHIIDEAHVEDTLVDRDERLLEQVFHVLAREPPASKVVPHGVDVGVEDVAEYLAEQRGVFGGELPSAEGEPLELLSALILGRLGRRCSSR